MSETEARKTYKPGKIEVTRAFWFDSERATFDVVLDDVIYIYGCGLFRNSKTGSEFISPPAKKDKNGKWWNICFISLDPSIKREIINMVKDYKS